MTRAIFAIVLSIVLAGCLADAPAETAPSPSAGGEEPTETTDADGSAPDPAAAVVDTPRALHLTGDFSFAEPPPDSESRIPLPTPANSPETSGSLIWEGELPWAVNASEDGIELVFYLSSNTASVRANTIPVFTIGPLAFPGMWVEARLGNLSWSVELEGPQTLVAGEVAEVRVPLRATAYALPAGARASFALEAAYSHVAGAAEFQVVLGPDAPARFDVA